MVQCDRVRETIMILVALLSAFCQILTYVIGQSDSPPTFYLEDFNCGEMHFMTERCNDKKPFETVRYDGQPFVKPNVSSDYFAAADGDRCSQSKKIFAGKGTSVEVMFSSRKYVVNDNFTVSLVDADDASDILDQSLIEIDIGVNLSRIMLTIREDRNIVVKMYTESRQLDRLIAVHFLKMHVKESGCTGPTTDNATETTAFPPVSLTSDASLTTETPQVECTTTVTDCNIHDLTKAELQLIRNKIYKWVSISTVAIVVATVSLTMSICVCMFHVQRPTKYECSYEEESVVVQTGVSRLGSSA